jgi:hypothetical protein
MGRTVPVDREDVEVSIGDHGESFVPLYVHDYSVGTVIVALSPDEARAVAAALLDRADVCDFYELRADELPRRCPRCAEPRRPARTSQEG